MAKIIFFTALILAAAALIEAQLSGTVGPLTSYKSKATKKTCDITKYGAVADGKTDISTALINAWGDCKVGGLVYVPPGTYALSTWVALKDGSASAFQLDGTIVRNSDSGGHMLSFTSCNDFEFFSGNSKGAFQGYGYKLLQNGNYGPRFLRFTGIKNFSIHGFALVDSASYYMVIDTGTNGEVYNVIIRGISSIGATDGIDVWGTNMWIHDVEVTNGDECVTVKSPSKNFRIESIYCNISGGTAIGSLSTGTAISDISYYRLYMNQADACFLKTNNGDGTVSNIVWDTVILHGSTFGIVLDESWGASRGSTGVQLSNLTFTNWHGVTGSNSRTAIRLDCDPDVPCYDIHMNNVNIWTESGSYITTSCENVYGTGYCIKNDDTSKLSTYTSVGTVTVKPSYSTASMPSDLASGFPSTKSFVIPAVPTSFYPGATPFSKLLSLSAAGGLAKRSLPTPI